MNRQVPLIHLHMGCGESLNQELRKDRHREVNQHSDGASIVRPATTKKRGMKVRR